jgi:nitroreductase
VDTLDAMTSARSMRWFTADPVPDDLIDKVVWAGTRASSPNNTQAWDFVVVTDPTVREQIAEAIGTPPASAWADLPADPSARATVLGSRNLLENLADVPAIVFVCGSNTFPEQAPVLEWAYSAMFAAAQNMLVAARSMGLGAAFTALHRAAEPKLRTLLAIPDDRLVGVLMPIGWPGRPFGPVRRKPLQEVIHRDRW